MAIQGEGNDPRDVPGVIKDETEKLRYDPGEAAKDAYERADAYEKDKIELRGIVFFTLGLVLLIGVTFGLMALLQRAMEDQASDAYKKDKSPMAMSATENLPPEPRLQAAPGFEVTNPKTGEVIKLELREPQAEYRELMKQWKDVWKNGNADKNTGAVTALPIEEAKKRVLEGNMIKTRAAEQADKANKEVRNIPSYSSGGRKMEQRKQ